jgi:CHAD domain-containing protein
MQPQVEHHTIVSFGQMRSAAAIASRLEQQQLILAALLQSGQSSNDAIHRCRVLIKRLRAWIRLVRPVHATSGSKATDKKLQRLGRQLGAARDQQVLKDTVQSLAAGTTDTQAKSACRKLRRRMSATADAAPLPATAAATLDKLRLPAAAKLDHAELREGLLVNYSKTRKLSRVALADTSDANKLHRFRRWVKYLHYQLSLLYPLKKSALAQPAMLKTLGTTLGQMHDLHVLLEALRDRFVEPDDAVQRVAQLAQARMSELTQDFVATTQALFALKPKAFLRLV